MLIDLHTHTTPLSDDSELSLPQLVLRAREAGLDGICLTEHERFWNAAELGQLSARYGLLILPGVEINADEGHFLVFGIETYRFGMHHASFLRRVVDEAGGAMVLAHPFRRNMPSGEGHENYQRSLVQANKGGVLDLVEAIETVNGKASDGENAFSQELGKRFALKGCGGSDAHKISEVGSAATCFDNPIGGVADLIAELRGGRFREIRAPLPSKKGTLSGPEK